MSTLSDELRTEPIPRLLARFSFPAVAGMMLHSVNSLIDRAFIGHYVGENGLAGIAVAFPLFILLLGGTMLIGSGMASAVSIALGAGDSLGMKRLLIAGFLLLTLFLPPLALTLFPWLDNILYTAGASTDTIELARAYIIPLILCYLPMAIGGGLAETIRAQGFPKYALVVTAASPLVNIILDAVFIGQMGLGMRGAGMATAAGYVVSSIIAVQFYIRHFSERGKSVQIGTQEPNFLDYALLAPYKRILFLGLPSFLLQAGSAIYAALLNMQLLKYGGDNAVAIMSVVFSASTLVLLPVVGIGQGMQPIVGYNQGAGRYNRVRAAWLSATIMATVILLLGFFVAEFFPRNVFRFFGTSAQFIEEGARALRVTFILIPLVGFQIIAACYFQAVGKARRAIILAVMRQIVILPALLFTLPIFFGLNGIWAVSAASDLLATIIAVPFLIYEFRNPGLAHIVKNTFNYIPGSFRSRG